MNAFSGSCAATAAKSFALLEPFLKEQALDGRYVETAKGNLSRILQTTVGDVLLNDRDRRVWAIELKAEEENLHGNFFLETWSNAAEGWQTPGWMFTLNTDILLYHFLDEKRFFSIKFKALKRWAFDLPSTKTGTIYDWPEKEQHKHIQKNRTRGRCVPIKVIRDAVGFGEYVFSAGNWSLKDRYPEPAPIVPIPGTFAGTTPERPGCFGNVREEASIVPEPPMVVGKIRSSLATSLAQTQNGNDRSSGARP